MYKFDIVKKLIAGFTCIIIFGWFSSKRIEDIENIQLKAHNVEINILECRREEKHVII